MNKKLCTRFVRQKDYIAAAKMVLNFEEIDVVEFIAESNYIEFVCSDINELFKFVIECGNKRIAIDKVKCVL